MQNENGVLADEDRDIVSIMGKYFNSVYSEPIYGDMPDMNDMYETEIQDIQVSREDIQKRLEKLNMNKSCGPDNIHPRVLRETAKSASIPLEKIFNLSLSSGECPNDWRTANVTPMHKKVTEQILVTIDQLVLQVRYARFLRQLSGNTS